MAYPWQTTSSCRRSDVWDFIAFVAFFFLLFFLVHRISIDDQLYFKLNLRTVSAFLTQFLEDRNGHRARCKRANLPSNRKQNEIFYLRMRKTDILHRPHLNILKESNLSCYVWKSTLTHMQYDTWGSRMYPYCCWWNDRVTDFFWKISHINSEVSNN